MDILKSIIVILIISIPGISDCADFTRVQEDYSTGRIRYIVNGISISVTECGYLSKSVLQNVSDDSIAGEFDWSKMQNENFKKKTFSRECIRLKYEMNQLRVNNAN